MFVFHVQNLNVTVQLAGSDALPEAKIDKILMEIDEMKDLQAAQKEQFEVVASELEQVQNLLANPPGGGSAEFKKALKDVAAQIRANTETIRGFVKDAPGDGEPTDKERVELTFTSEGAEGMDVIFRARRVPKGLLAPLWGPRVLDPFLTGLRSPDIIPWNSPVDVSANLRVDGQKTAGEDFKNLDLAYLVRGQINAVEGWRGILKDQEDDKL